MKKPLCILLSGLMLAAGKPKKAEQKPLNEQSAQEILRRYSFVGDFEQHPAEREVSDEIFWRYPLAVPKIDFAMETEFKDLKRELPATKGEGRPIDHLNRGRMLFLEGKTDEAKATWLSGRARYGRTYPFHRRSDYFVGYAFMKQAMKDMQARGVGFADSTVKATFANAATFLSWAFIMKEDQPDPLVEFAAPKGLYNLAALYWQYDRFSGSYGAAEKGLNFLRKTGRGEYRAQFHRIEAEAHIKNRTYLEAVRELDAAIRQDDQDLKQASAAFARVGDIYFDLNNYDLAEDAYALGAKLDEAQQQMNPAQLVLRGESLFWLGKFSEAQKILHFALEGSNYRKQTAAMPPDYAAYAALRIADAYLARKDFEKARLEYYKVSHDYRSSAAGRLAKIREACLELPYYQGKNVGHARELLEEAKTGVEIPALAQEMAWSCQVGSYTDRERTPEMLDRVKAFAASYPESRYLKTFVEPVRTFQAGKIDPYFDKGDTYRALSFFEKNRRNLFPRVPPELAEKLFVAYVDSYQPEAAKEFYEAAHKNADNSDIQALREVVVTTELVDKKAGKEWERKNNKLAQDLAKRAWTLAPDKVAANYVQRVLNSGSTNRHLAWLWHLAQTWGQKESSYVCDLEYPLLSRIYELRPESRAQVTGRLSEIIAADMPALFKRDESCGLSLLELEARALREDTKQLAERYLKRTQWPLVGGYLHTYWTISERVFDEGDKASAQKMWEVIRDKGPTGTPEVQFAKARLDPTKTELEKLWD